MIYKNITNFLKVRTIELFGLTLLFIALLLGVSFFSYSPSDPILLYGIEGKPINNLLGVYGNLVADFLLQSFGLAAFLLLITLMVWSISLIVKKKIKRIKIKIFYLILYLNFSCLSIHATFNNSFWLIDNGNSGFIGEILYNWIFNKFPALYNENIYFFYYLKSCVFYSSF